LVYSSVAAWRSAARRRGKSRQFVEIVAPDPDLRPSVGSASSTAAEDHPVRLAAELLLPAGILLRIYADTHDSTTGGRG
jgi:hypothetical protein